MSVIYEPKGRAREYSPLACNLYLNCTHRCEYCYCVKLRGRGFFCDKPSPRKGVLENVRKELSQKVFSDQVLLSFVGDVYCDAEDGNAITRAVLEEFLEHKVPTAILTKGGKRCLKDLDLFKQFGEHFQIGSTLTFDNDRDSMASEPGGALPSERLDTLKKLHDEGIRTFASFEPVIKPAQSLALIKKTLEDDSVDVYKVGKINNFRTKESIDWTAFLESALEMIRGYGKAVYVKHDLRQCAPSVKLYGNEVLPDDFNVK